jgi:hypothetical protein
LLRPVGLLLGAVEPVLRLPGRRTGLRGQFVGPGLLLGVGPAPGQVGGLGGHVGGGLCHRGGFLGPFGPLLGLVGPLLRLVGPPAGPVGEFLCLLGVRPALSGRLWLGGALVARLVLHRVPGHAVRFAGLGHPLAGGGLRALSCVMIISSRRVGPRLPAMGKWHDHQARHGTWRAEQARESWTLVLVAIAGAGRRWLGSGQAVRCH